MRHEEFDTLAAAQKRVAQPIAAGLCAYALSMNAGAHQVRSWGGGQA